MRECSERAGGAFTPGAAETLPWLSGPAAASKDTSSGKPSLQCSPPSPVYLVPWAAFFRAPTTSCVCVSVCLSIRLWMRSPLGESKDRGFPGAQGVHSKHLMSE